MGAKSVFLYVNFKAIFCVALVAALTNIVSTQNLYMSMLDDARDALMSFSSGSSPTSPSGPPPKKRTTPSNKFLEALASIERAMYEAQAVGSLYRPSTRRLAKIKANIKLATRERNHLFARQSLGRGLYSAIQLAKRSGRKKRTITRSAVMTFMDMFKREIGGSAFDTFMSVNETVTLMFAIDDTGSMSNDIQAAKYIAEYIVNYQRNVVVDYILSPFNDPGTGPVEYKSSTEKTQFVDAIGRLRASGGGDCPELTFKGILGALRAGPQPGSPLYVFTDASAKDHTTENMDEVLSIAGVDGISINFFTTGLCWRSSLEPFERLTRETCGQMFQFRNSAELRRATGLTARSLGGSTCLATGGAVYSSGKKKRSVSGSSYSIPIDDSTEKVIVSVTTKRMGPRITLKNPRGYIIRSGKISLSRGAIYQLNNPRPGTWRLTVSSAGKHSYQIRGSSKTNVDFEHFFVMIPKRGRSKKPIPISHPLIGQKALVILTVAGSNKINKNTLNLDFMSKNGKRLGTAAVTPSGTSSAHFTSSFTPPSEPFKLKLRGKTKAGYNFERTSRNIVHPSHALIRVVYARNEFTVPAGGRGFVVFVVHNTGPTEVFDIKVKDSLKLVHRLRRSSILVRQGRKSFFSVTFKAPRSAVRGKGDEVLATITGRKSKKTVGHVVMLMVSNAFDSELHSLYKRK